MCHEEEEKWMSHIMDGKRRMNRFGFIVSMASC